MVSVATPYCHRTRVHRTPAHFTMLTQIRFQSQVNSRVDIKIVSYDTYLCAYLYPSNPNNGI